LLRKNKFFFSPRSSLPFSSLLTNQEKKQEKKMSGSQDQGVVFCTAQITEMMGKALQEQIDNKIPVICVVPDFNIRSRVELQGEVKRFNQKNFGVTKQLEIGGSKNTPRGVNSYFSNKFFDGSNPKDDNPAQRCLNWMAEHQLTEVEAAPFSFFGKFQVVAMALIRKYVDMDKSQLPTNKDFTEELEMELGKPGLYENPDYKVFAGKIGFQSETIDAFVAGCKDFFGHICNFSGLVGVDGCTTDVVNLVVWHMTLLGKKGPFSPAQIASHFALIADPLFASDSIASIVEHKSDGEPDDLSVSALIWAHKVRLYKAGVGPKPELLITFQASSELLDITEKMQESPLPEGITLKVMVDSDAKDNAKKVRKALEHRTLVQWLNSFLE
jgi:vacuolar-type H+-ATPase subunit F/Vma7